MADKWTDRQIGRQTDWQIDGLVDRQIGRQTDWQTDKQADEQMNKQIDGYADRWIEKKTDRWPDRKGQRANGQSLEAILLSNLIKALTDISLNLSEQGTLTEREGSVQLTS